MRRASSRTDVEPRLRSLPRVYGTTQYEQNLSQPSMIVMYPRYGFWRAVNSVSKVSSVCRSSRPVMRFSPASSRVSISGSLRYEADPETSETYGARSKIFSPSCCATHPSTPKRFPCLWSFL